MNAEEQRRDRIRREAAAWMARISGGRTALMERSLSDWRAADPEHEAAWISVEQSYRDALLLRHSDLATKHRLPAPQSPSSGWLWGGGLAAACLALFLVWPGLNLTAQATVMLATEPGQVRRAQLSDGSAVLLLADSRLRVHLSSGSRSANLEQGQARLTIAHGSQPFKIVVRAIRVVVAEGAIVANADAGGSVTLLTGKGEASTGLRAASKPMSAGEVARVGPSGELRVFPPPASTPPAALEFKSKPLAEIASAANQRDADHPIRIAPEIALLRVTGVFHADENWLLGRALASALGLRLRPQPDGSLLLTAK